MLYIVCQYGFLRNDFVGCLHTLPLIQTVGFPDSYTVMYSDGENQPMEITRDSTTLSAVLMELQPLTQYTVRVRAGNTAGDSDFSAGDTFSTFGEDQPHSMQCSFNIIVASVTVCIACTFIYCTHYWSILIN